MLRNTGVKSHWAQCVTGLRVYVGSWRGHPLAFFTSLQINAAPRTPLPAALVTDLTSAGWLQQLLQHHRAANSTASTSEDAGEAARTWRRRSRCSCPCYATLPGPPLNNLTRKSTLCWHNTPLRGMGIHQLHQRNGLPILHGAGDLARGTLVVPGVRAARHSLHEQKNCFSFIAHFISLHVRCGEKSGFVNSDNKKATV